MTLAIQDHYSDPILDDAVGRDVIIDNRDNSNDLEDYQIQLNIDDDQLMLQGERGIRFVDENLQVLDYWEESDQSEWIKVAKVIGSKATAIRMLQKEGIDSASDGDTTFEFFDDFEDSSVIQEKYITNWTKSSNNPLQNKTCQNWLIAVYSNYNNEDKIYIFEQRDAAPSNNIECWSFNRSDADNPSNWTDHGVVFTGTHAHDNGHIEPHGIIFETQAMADARTGVPNSERKWRLYYCAKGDGEGVDKYSVNFAVASESDLTNWTAYSGNPVYDHDAERGYADPKVCIYNNQVWLHHCKYKSGVSCDPAFFSYSDNGIDNWTDVMDKNWHDERSVLGTLVSFDTGILLTGNPEPRDEYDAYFTTDGANKESYSNNPILTCGESGEWDDERFYWNTIVVDKNGSPNLNGAGIYYLYYIGYNGSAYGLGLATSTTLTEEKNETLNTDKWEVSGSPSISNGVITVRGIRRVTGLNFNLIILSIPFWI